MVGQLRRTVAPRKPPEESPWTYASWTTWVSVESRATLAAVESRSTLAAMGAKMESRQTLGSKDIHGIKANTGSKDPRGIKANTGSKDPHGIKANTGNKVFSNASLNFVGLKLNK